MTLYRTGRKKYSMLQEVDADTGIPTGNVKPNISGDPDYVPPVIDEDACPEGPIPESTTTTSTTSTTTTSTTTLIPDAFRIHVAYQYAYFAGVSYVPFDVDFEITDNGSTTYFDGDVAFPIYMSGNEVVTNVPTRSSPLVDITINSIVTQANWMKIMYSTNSYPNPPTVGVILYEGPVTDLTGLAIPIDHDGSQDILVIEFSTTAAAPTTTTTTGAPPVIEICDVFLCYNQHIVLYKDGVVYTLATQPDNRRYVDIAIIGNKLYGRIGADIDEYDIGISSLTYVTTHADVLPGFGPGLGSDDTYLYADISSAIYRIDPSTWTYVATDMGTGYPGQGDMMLIGDDYMVGTVKKIPGFISTLQTWKKLVTGSTVGFEQTIMTNYSTVLNDVFGMFQQDGKFYLLTSNGLIWEYNTATLVATKVDNLSAYYSGNEWNGAAQRGLCGDAIYLTTTTTIA